MGLEPTTITVIFMVWVKFLKVTCMRRAVGIQTNSYKDTDKYFTLTGSTLENLKTAKSTVRANGSETMGECKKEYGPKTS